MNPICFRSFGIPPICNRKAGNAMRENISNILNIVPRVEENPFRREEEIPAFKNYLINLVEYPLTNPSSLILPRFSLSLLLETNLPYDSFIQQQKPENIPPGVIRGNDKLWVRIFSYSNIKDLWTLAQTSRYTLILVSAYYHTKYLKYIGMQAPWYFISPMRFHTHMRTFNNIYDIQHIFRQQVKYGNTHFVKYTTSAFIIHYLAPILKPINHLLRSKGLELFKDIEYMPNILSKLLNPEKGISALLIAAQEGYTILLKYLLTIVTIITPKEVSFEGLNVIGCAIKWDNPDMLQAILTELITRNIDFVTFCQNTNLLKLALMNPPPRKIFGLVLTTFAQYKGNNLIHTQFVEALCYSILDIQTNKEMLLFLDIANKYKIDLNLLVENGKYTPLIAAAKHGNLEGINALVNRRNELKINLNITNKNKKTALHYAAMSGSFQLVDKLLSNGANATIMDVHSRSVFLFALRTGNVDIILQLLDYINYNNISKYCSGGYTPLQLAKWTLQPPIYKKVFQRHTVLTQEEFIYKKLSHKTKKSTKMQKEKEKEKEIPMELLKLQFKLSKSASNMKQVYSVNMRRLPIKSRRRKSLNFPTPNMDTKSCLPILKCKKGGISSGVIFTQPFKYGNSREKSFNMGNLREFPDERVMSLIKWNTIAEIRRMKARKIIFEAAKGEKLEMESEGRKFGFGIFSISQSRELPPSLISFSLDNSEIPTNRYTNPKTFLNLHQMDDNSDIEFFKKSLVLQREYHQKLSQPVFGGSKEREIIRLKYTQVTQNISVLGKIVAFLNKENGIFKEILAGIFKNKIEDAIKIELNQEEPDETLIESPEISSPTGKFPQRALLNSPPKIFQQFSDRILGHEQETHRRKGQTDEDNNPNDSPISKKIIKFSAFNRDVEYLKSLKKKKQKEKTESPSPILFKKQPLSRSNGHKKRRKRPCCIRKQLGFTEENIQNALPTLHLSSTDSECNLREKINSLQQMIKKQNERCKIIDKFLKLRQYQGNVQDTQNTRNMYHSVGFAQNIECNSPMAHTFYGGLNIQRGKRNQVSRIKELYKTLSDSTGFQIPSRGVNITNISNVSPFIKSMRNNKSNLLGDIGSRENTRYIKSARVLNGVGYDIRSRSHATTFIAKSYLSPFQSLNSSKRDNLDSKNIYSRGSHTRKKMGSDSISGNMLNFVENKLLYTKDNTKEQTVFTTFPDKYDYFSRKLQELKDDRLLRMSEVSQNLGSKDLLPSTNNSRNLAEELIFNYSRLGTQNINKTDMLNSGQKSKSNPFMNHIVKRAYKHQINREDLNSYTNNQSLNKQENADSMKI